MNRYVLALDLGASSGRAMLAAYDGEKIRLLLLFTKRNPACGVV